MLKKEADMSRNWAQAELQAASAAMQSAGKQSYEEFSNEVNAAIAAKKAIDDFAVRQKDGVQFCPRCGRMTVKDQLNANALSRHAEIYICDMCGMDEAIRDFHGKVMPLKDWAIAKPGRLEA